MNVLILKQVRILAMLSRFQTVFPCVAEPLHFVLAKLFCKLDSIYVQGANISNRNISAAVITIIIALGE